MDKNEIEDLNLKTEIDNRLGSILYTIIINKYI